MTRGYPLSRARKDEIVDLAEAGLNGKQIASRLDLGFSTVYRVLRFEFGKSRPTSVIIRVVSDSTGTFSPRAEFTMLDLACGVQLGTWPKEIVFEVNGHLTHFDDGGCLVRDDGKWLETWSGGYKWAN